MVLHCFIPLHSYVFSQASIRSKEHSRVIFVRLKFNNLCFFLLLQRCTSSCEHPTWSTLQAGSLSFTFTLSRINHDFFSLLGIRPRSCMWNDGTTLRGNDFGRLSWANKSDGRIHELTVRGTFTSGAVPWD